MRGLTVACFGCDIKELGEKLDSCGMVLNEYEEAVQKKDARIKELERERDRLNREGSSICLEWHFELEAKDARIKELSDMLGVDGLAEWNIMRERIKELEESAGFWGRTCARQAQQLEEVKKHCNDNADRYYKAHSQLEKAEKKNAILMELFKDENKQRFLCGSFWYLNPDKTNFTGFYISKEKYEEALEKIKQLEAEE